MELTFDSKGDLYCIKDKVHIWMPMLMPRCRCRDANVEFSKWPFLFYVASKNEFKSDDLFEKKSEVKSILETKYQKTWTVTVVVESV